MLPGLVRFPTIGGSSNLSLYEAIIAAGLTSNCKLVLDAGDASSYSAGQSWLDRSGNGYDFFRGATSGSNTDDPTFTGSAGDLTSSTYWSFDGGDFFTYDTTNEAWMEALHKDNALFSLIASVYIPDAAVHGVFGTMGTATTNIGVRLQFTTVEKLQFIVAGGASALNKTTDNAVSAGAWHIIGLSIDEAGGSVSFFYTDGGYSQVSASNTFDAAYLSPSSSSATYTMQIGAAGNNGFPLANTTRLGFLGIWQGTALSKANFDTLYASTKGRYGLV